MSSKTSATCSPETPCAIDPGFNVEDFLAALTQSPGVYRMLGADASVLYVGKAKNLKRRVTSYFQKTGLSPRIALMVAQVRQIEITATRSEAEALILENTLIKKLAPKYNILFRDDKSYPYIALSGGQFPRLFYHRGGFDKQSRYFGPFPSGLAARESLQFLQKTFLLRTCEDAVFVHRSRPCLMHQIKRCKAPCVGFVTARGYQADVQLVEQFLKGKHAEVIEGLGAAMNAAAEKLDFEQAAFLRDQIRNLQTVLHKQYVSSARDTDADVIAVVIEHGELCVNLAMVRAGLHLGDRAFITRIGESGKRDQPDNATDDIAEGLLAFISQHYATQPAPARVIVETLPSSDAAPSVPLVLPRSEQEHAWLSMAHTNARLALQQRRQTRTRGADRLVSLQEALDLPEKPHRIECFDISHTLGEGTVASCVVCVDGLMKKSDYRRFNISGITPGDDYAAMRQALRRRYERVAHGETAPPDLVLIDGGRGQHGVAREVFADLGLDHLQSVGVAKGEGRKSGLETLFVHGRSEPIQLPMDNVGFHLIQEIRDEAHRFAIVGHRARRAKARSSSALEGIVGVGPTRRRALLAHFGGLDGVRAATAEDIRRVAGISTTLADTIHRHLHSAD